MKEETKKENVAVVNAVSSTERFFATYKKTIIAVVAVIVVIVAGAYCYYKFSYIPNRTESTDQMVWAENQFQNNNWEAALNGDGNNLGFKQIIEEYGSAASTSAYLYAGICEMRRDSGDFAAALGYLEKFDGDEIMNGRAASACGDIYCEQGDYVKAAEMYGKAASFAEVSFNSGYLFKQGLCLEKAGQNDKALECYRKIQDFYSQTPEGEGIQKYITRLETKSAE